MDDKLLASLRRAMSASGMQTATIDAIIDGTYVAPPEETPEPTPRRCDRVVDLYAEVLREQKLMCPENASVKVRATTRSMAVDIVAERHHMTKVELGRALHRRKA